MEKFQDVANQQEKTRKFITILWYSLRNLVKESEELNYLYWFMENSDLKSAQVYLRIRKMIFLYISDSRRTISLLDNIHLKFGIETEFPEIFLYNSIIKIESK